MNVKKIIIFAGSVAVAVAAVLLIVGSIESRNAEESRGAANSLASDCAALEPLWNSLLKDLDAAEDMTIAEHSEYLNRLEALIAKTESQELLEYLRLWEAEYYGAINIEWQARWVPHFLNSGRVGCGFEI
jgi:hypothetical protein